MATCSNNAATCCVQLKKWEEASKFAKNALILLDALYGKRGKRIHTILNREGTVDARLFGEWRVKSYLLVARSCMGRGQEEDAVGVLKKARALAMEYIEKIETKNGNCIGNEEEASLKALTSQAKEVRRLLAECAERKKATKKLEKKRAQAMFGGGNSNEEKTKKKTSVKTMGEGMAVQQQIRQPPQQRDDGDQINDVVPYTPATGEDSSRCQNTEKENTQGAFVRKSSLNSSKSRQRPSARKSVSFSESPPTVKEFTKSEDQGVPWYKEHKEALIMMAIAGFSVVALMGLRRAYR